jgi:hypothetical protein
MFIKTDTRGYVTPYTAVPSTREALKETVVDIFITATTRVELFSGYIECCNLLFDLLGVHRQWVDGSFTSSKKNPADIDVLCFIGHEFSYEVLSELAEAMKTKKARFGVVLYAIQTYPKGHPRNNLHKIDRVYWLNHFTKTKKWDIEKRSTTKAFWNYVLTNFVSIPEGLIIIPIMNYEDQSTSPPAPPTSSNKSSRSTP